MRVMISLPMDGKSEDDIKSEWTKVANALCDLHIDVVDTLFQDEYPGECLHPGLYYMAKTVDVMSNVDAVFFHKDWNSARGCRIERKIAEAYGIKILDWDFIFPILEQVRYYADGEQIGEAVILKNQRDFEPDNHIPRID